jgi:hypothetical protein
MADGLPVASSCVITSDQVALFVSAAAMARERAPRALLDVVCNRATGSCVGALLKFRHWQEGSPLMMLDANMMQGASLVTASETHAMVRWGSRVITLDMTRDMARGAVEIVNTNVAEDTDFHLSARCYGTVQAASLSPQP